ncbi:hypothetical protein [Streptomyces sp. NPDC013457]|uniref:hypothetical protein n=1 Tax=Streptomyces sp. NPDC013457 TaxID=3364866 RepID=UPI0036F7728D
MEGPLDDVAAVWVFCDPLAERAAWTSTLPHLNQEKFFTWKANLRPEGWEPLRDEPSLLRRLRKRAATHGFPALPYYESTFRALPNTATAVGRYIDELKMRSSGFACAVGEGNETGDSWVRSSQIMEEHFSLSRDFKNSIDLEAQRRSVTSMYVSLSIQAGFCPVIPLNKHPNAGFTLFCPTRHYAETLQRMSTGARVLEGDAAEDQIRGFIEQGGDLAYI